MENELVSAFVSLEYSKVLSIANKRMEDGNDPALLFGTTRKGSKR